MPKNQKKNFKNNPALQFISTAENYTDNTQYTYNTDDTHDKEITLPVQPAAGNERKTKRLNLLIQPSTIKNLTKIAYINQTSVNDLINTVLKEYVKSETAVISKYDAVFEEEKEKQ